MIPVFFIGWLGGLADLNLSSTLGMRNGKMHNGIDINVPSGTPIYAPIDGMVMQINRSTQFGLTLTLQFRDEEAGNYSMRFSCLSSTVAAMGQTVRAGELIANTGGNTGDKPNCGRSSGAHLHLEMYFGVVPINPMKFLGEICNFNGSPVGGGRVLAASGRTLQDPASNYNNTDISLLVNENAIERDVEVNPTSVAPTGRLALGIWQITKLIMDSSVRQRQVYDSSIAMQTGPLGNFFNKVCQQPFVELSGDTFGDQYYFIVRKPPFDKEGIQRLQTGFCLTIDESEIISTNITWNTEGIYSWYQFIPYAEVMGMDNVNLYMPAVFFPEYAAIWGSREMTIRSQYTNVDVFTGFSEKEIKEADNKEKLDNANRIVRNAIGDLKYMVESNAYNPFTRRGTITLNGDRRIKRGTLIIMPNGEQFYVDSVSNSLSYRGTSVQRNTVLQVSHGMFLKYINGVNVNGKKMSYFNIIDWGGEPDLQKVTADKWRDSMSGWKVDVDVFTFFLRRYQLLYQ